MTEEQEEAALKSLAEALSKLAHARPRPDDDDDRYVDESIDLARLFRVIPTLCSHHVAGLSDLVMVLLELQEHKIEHGEDRAVQ